jgi:hypothetical protein
MNRVFAAVERSIKSVAWQKTVSKQFSIEFMYREISERDWKIFRRLHPVALNRYCELILREVKVSIERAESDPHEQYLKLYRLIHNRDKKLGIAFNDFRRSTALMQIGIIHKMGLLRADELAEFSDETLAIVEMYGPVPSRGSANPE